MAGGRTFLLLRRALLGRTGRSSDALGGRGKLLFALRNRPVILFIRRGDVALALLHPFGQHRLCVIDRLVRIHGFYFPASGLAGDDNQTGAVKVFRLRGQGQQLIPLPDFHRGADQAAGFHLLDHRFPLLRVLWILEVFIIKAPILRRIGDKHGAHLIVAGSVNRVKGKGRMLPIIGEFAVVVQLGEHLPVIHMIAVQRDISVFPQAGRRV